MNVRLRRRGPHFGWSLSVLVGLFAAAVLLVATRTHITGLHYRLARLVAHESLVQGEVEKLRIEAAALARPERLEARALAMGLRYPAPGQVLTLEQLAVLRVDVAAAKDHP